MSDPIHVIIRRKKAAGVARDLIYGHKARPWPVASLNAWALIVAHYCGKGFMRYGEMLMVAEELAGRGYREEDVGVRLHKPDLDDRLKQEFASALLVRAKELQKLDQGARHRQFQEQLERGREKQWAKEAALAGRCALCGSHQPTNCGCGVGYLVPDGKGSLRPAQSV